MKQRRNDDLNEERTLTEDEAARYLGLKTGKTLYSWRRRGIAPRHMIYAGKCIRYRLRDLNEWKAQQLVTA
jgi:hypothetical protein